jgi:hypothetical protein
VSCRSSMGRIMSLEFLGVAAFSWQENNDSLLPGEPWDGICELYESPWLVEHSAGRTLHSVDGLRHIRLNFNEWGRLNVLCTTFSVAA